MGKSRGEVLLASALCLLLRGSVLHVQGRGLVEAGACPRGVQLWDKHFDTCNWCVCMPFGWTCTRTVCNALTNVPPACNGRQKWRDGCYTCTCQKAGQITCRADEACVRGLRRHSKPCHFGNLCLCGVDGVPVCAADFTRASAYAGVSESLLPLSWRRTRTLLLGRSCSVAERWYLGGRRCHCRHHDNAHRRHCGQPAKVAQALDVFSVQHVLCERGMSWTEGTCRRCRCHVSGVVFCAPDPACQQKETNELEPTAATAIPDDRCSRRGQVWEEGCQVCYCSHAGKLICLDKNDCNPSQQPQPGEKEETGAGSSAQPEAASGEAEEGDCGQRRDGEQFWKKCNLCECRGGTVICQQKACPFPSSYD